MNYKIEFYKNVNTVSKIDIKKMGLENMFDYYNGNDIRFLRIVATLYDNNWKASKEIENDDYVVYKFFSNKYPNILYLYFYNNIVDEQDYNQTMDIVKMMDVNYKPVNNIIYISDYLDESNDKSVSKYKYVKYGNTCNRIINKKKIALYALTGAFIALIGIAAGRLIAEKSNNNDKQITSNLDDYSDQKVFGVSNQVFYDTVEKAKNDQLEVYENTNDNQQFFYGQGTKEYNSDESKNDIMKEKSR